MSNITPYAHNLSYPRTPKTPTSVIVITISPTSFYANYFVRTLPFYLRCEILISLRQSCLPTYEVEYIYECLLIYDNSLYCYISIITHIHIFTRVSGFFYSYWRVFFYKTAFLPRFLLVAYSNLFCIELCNLFYTKQMLLVLL